MTSAEAPCATHAPLPPMCESGARPRSGFPFDATAASPARKARRRCASRRPFPWVFQYVGCSTHRGDVAHRMHSARGGVDHIPKENACSACGRSDVGGGSRLWLRPTSRRSDVAYDRAGAEASAEAQPNGCATGPGWNRTSGGVAFNERSRTDVNERRAINEPRAARPAARTSRPSRWCCPRRWPRRAPLWTDRGRASPAASCRPALRTSPS